MVVPKGGSVGSAFWFPAGNCSVYTRTCAYIFKMALTLVDHYAPILLEEFDERPSCSTVNTRKGQPGERALTIVSCRLKYSNALFDCRFRISFVIRGIDRRQQCDVHAEGLIGQFASLPDCFAEGVWVRLGKGG